MIKKRGRKILSLIMFIVGTILLINAELNITGAFLGFKNVTTLLSFFVGIMLLFLAIVVFSTASLSLESRTISSSIKQCPSILRLTQEAVKDQFVEREMNHLIEELYKGNFEAGLGHPGHIEGTKIHYLRGRNGARLYYKRKGENDYEVVGKSAKGRNQEQVIDKLKQIYS
jgi:hypothetical protein